MATLTIVINNGEAVVTADGSKVSCSSATALEKALGQTTKSVSTGTKSEPATLTQKK